MDDAVRRTLSWTFGTVAVTLGVAAVVLAVRWQQAQDADGLERAAPQALWVLVPFAVAFLLAAVQLRLARWVERWWLGDAAADERRVADR